MAAHDSWICCQIGAREHYAIPRSLHQAGSLHVLFTDIWSPPDRFSPGRLHRRASDRFHPELSNANVRSWVFSALALELRFKLTKPTPWTAIIIRNEWFQRAVVAELRSIHRAHPFRKFIVFSYSYAALKIFEFAKSVGWRTVLGQIDPGPAEERLVARLDRESPLGQTGAWIPAPASYWEAWRAECEIADKIVVNSPWSGKSLASEGISENKISIVPLVLQAATGTETFERLRPRRFTKERPLRLLFLGQAGLRKGIELVITAADSLAGQPVEIWVVGPVQIGLTAAHKDHPVLRWFGSVPRSAVDRYYREADAFLFPTFSDGFGITQLEAQAWKLPLIVSRFCGEAVDHGVNGLVLDPLTADVLSGTIQTLLADPAQLERLSDHAALKPQHRMAGLSNRLTAALGESTSQA